MSQRVVVIGGVAGGMSCAARLKRLDDTQEVIVFERGTDVSFANCGMPYYIGDTITDRTRLVVQSPQSLHDRFGIDIRIRTEVVSFDPEAKTVQFRQVDTGEEGSMAYDELVLAPGAEPLRPPFPGVDREDVYVLSNLGHMDAIKVAAAKAKTAVVIGGGFIGLELTENLKHLGLDVTLVERLDQVLPSLDADMARPLHQELRLHGVKLHLSTTVTAIDDDGVHTDSGEVFPADMVLLSAGVRPRSELAKAAGLELGPRGHVVVDEAMHTSHPHVWAVGDVVTVKDAISGERVAVPLAGPANRQGRLVADNIAGRESRYRGTQGTSILQIFNYMAGATGLNERWLKGRGQPYHKAYLHPSQHPGYYPGAFSVHIKLLFSDTGKIYGVQAVSPDGVEVVVDAIATAIAGGLTVWDLEHLELAYSPQCGSAKHSVNMVGFIASNMLRGDVEMVNPEAIPEGRVLLDVRTDEEHAGHSIPNSLHIPVNDLRRRWEELPKDAKILIYCAAGLRGYVAYRFLKQKGLQVENLNGGITAWDWFQPEDKDIDPVLSIDPQSSEDANAGAFQALELDVCGLQCPGPLMEVNKRMKELDQGTTLRVRASDPGFTRDIKAWAERTGNTFLGIESDKGIYTATLRRGDSEAPVPTPIRAPGVPAKTLICFSNDLDKSMATFIIANGAAAMGAEVTIFFTFWGLSLLRKDNTQKIEKSWMEGMFGAMLPKGPKGLGLSKMNMGGAGSVMMQRIMRDKSVSNLSELMEAAVQAGIRLVACSMSMDVMGIKAEELIDGVEIGGVGYYLSKADEAGVNLFI